MGPRAFLDDFWKNKLLSLPGYEPRTLRLVASSYICSGSCTEGCKQKHAGINKLFALLEHKRLLSKVTEMLSRGESSSAISVMTHQTAQRHISQYFQFDFHCLGNLLMECLLSSLYVGHSVSQSQLVSFKVS